MKQAAGGEPIPPTRPGGSRRRWLGIGGALALIALAVGADLAETKSEPARATAVYPANVASTGQLREFELVAAPTSLPLLDGQRLDVWAYNGVVPGPILRANRGDMVRVRFTNRLPQPTTIHWHGIRLPNAMDGVPGVTQPPIAPGGTFTYEFQVKDAGTFWFHPHLRGSEQIERGLYGILIVDDPKAPPVDKELVWVLDDWLLDGTGQVDGRFNTLHDLAHDGRWGTVLTINGVRRPVAFVAPGERVRVRLINAANARVFVPDFGALQPMMMAFDALSTDLPLPAQGVEMAPGNRMDVEFTVPASSAGTTITVTDKFGRGETALVDLVVGRDAVVQKTVGPPSAEARVTLTPPELKGVLDSSPVQVFRLNARRGGPFGIEWTINDQPMRHEEHGAAHHGTRYRLPVERWSRIQFVNESFRLHPMHIHGQFFRVIARNGQPVDEHHWRDTVLIHPKETVDIAMFPRDEGVWMLHCHIQEHAESGMMTLVDVGAP